jgi:hydrogenase-4 membrane subunit HyfE
MLMQAIIIAVIHFKITVQFASKKYIILRLMSLAIVIGQ